MIHYSFLALLTVLLFVYAFFPVSHNIRKYPNDLPVNIANMSLNTEEIYKSDIENVVIIVIDALRLDFVQPDLMPYTTSAANQYGCFNKIKVESPTVTLPRIKAITMGSVPQFIDVITNLIGEEVLGDSIIHSFKRNKKKIVFYGDELWLKLFPNTFLRSEGTSSFYVNDFVEVDNNVTRNVDLELQKDDWNVMILHYLGLDHIGHVYGPKSTFISEKLKEMDGIVKDIYLALQNQHRKSLLLITGDHGMRDSGGHGGTTYSETTIPLVIIGIPCSNNSFVQTDISVNLASLLGLKIPHTSIGKIHKSFLRNVSTHHYLFALRYNSLLLSQKSNICPEYMEMATNFHLEYLKSNLTYNAEKAIELYENCSKMISQSLYKGAVKHDNNSLIVSLTILFNLLFIFVKKAIFPKDNVLYIEYFLLFFLVMLQFFTQSVVLVFITPIITFFFIMKNLRRLCSIRCKIDNVLFVMILLTVIQPLSFFSSSFIEEEHQFWYFVFNLLIVFLTTQVKFYRINFFLLACAFRFLRTMNQTGDQSIALPDFSDWLLEANNYFYLQTIFVVGLLTTWFCMNFLSTSLNYLEIYFTFIIYFLLFILKNQHSVNALLGKTIWVLIIVHFLVFGRKNIRNFWVLVVALLLKPYNVVLIPFCLYSSHIFQKFNNNDIVSTVFYIWMGNLLYFAQGHSNSLASVDISVGYIGLSSYDPFWVLLQILFHTYSFPILCAILLFSSLKSNNTNQIWTILFTHKLYITFITCLNTFINKHHLFIWTVFAPKLFVDCSHITVLFIEMLVFNLYKFLYFCNKKR